MQKNIQLIRDGTNPWGFRLIGGNDFKLPLTVVMVQSGSAAEKAGLQNGDEILYINGTTTQGLSHEQCHDVIVECGNILMLSISRGPYDNLEETAFQPIQATEDLDHMFQPSEVPDVRSNTASPFQLQTKPYRPFSTEPIVEVPPLENPIILNPDYQDEFPKITDEDIYKDTIFKLPISPQYVGVVKSNQKRTKVGFACEEHTKSDLNIENIEESAHVSEEKITINEIKYEQKMNNDLDITKIEETACLLVEESIEKAISVTEEIKTEIDVELHGFTSKSKSNQMSLLENKQENLETISESISTIKNETVSKIENNITNINENIENTNNKSTIINEIKETKQDKSSNHLATSTEIMSSDTIQVSEEETTIRSDAIVSENAMSSTLKLKDNSKTEVMDEKKLSQTSKNESSISQQNVKKSMLSQNEQNMTKTKETSTTSKLLAEQRAYILGLQTIPNIRGRAQSSYHQDMLLKTFFIHLTDVMVALSRIILYERPLSKYNSKEDLSKDVKQTENIETEFVTSKHSYTDSSNETSVHTEDKNNAFTQDEHVDKISSVNTNKTELVSDDEIKEQKVLSGSKMAQMTSKKSEELIVKMDAVVTEIQKNVETENIKVDTINEEIVNKENGCINNIEVKQELLLQDTEVKETKTENTLNTTTIQSKEIKHFNEAQHIKSEKCEETTKTVNESNAQTYIAIVEAHVYTNKEAIINKEIEISEKSEAIINKEIEISEKSQSSESSNIVNVIQSASIEQEEIKKDDLEISLEDAMAKSNIAIITCEPIKETIVDLQDTTIGSRKTSNVINDINYFTKTSNTEISNSEISQNMVSKETALVSVEKVTMESENTSERNQYNLEEVEKLAAEYESVTIQDSTCDTLESNESKIEFETECTLSQEVVTATVAFESEEIIQESSFTAKLQSKEISETHENITKICNLVNEEKSVIEEAMTTATKDTKVIENLQTNIETEDLRKKLSLDLNNNKQSKFNSQTSFEIDFSDTIKTPTPSHIPPTPLTDEYMFRLEIPLKESQLDANPPIDEIPNPDSIPEEHEDPNIVKKKLIPHIETTIESIIYDPPIASPPANNNTAPAFNKHGLNTADDDKEDIIDIERKSSLLASAIDETIKSIKEYKEQVGMCTTPYSSEPAFATDKQNELFKSEVEIAKPITVMKNNFKQEIIVALEKEIEINDEKLKTILNKEDEIVEQVKTKYDNINGEVTNVLNNEPKINGFDKSEIFGTTQGIINGMKDAVIDNEIINDIGKPGMTDEKIAELISGEAEMLREAHVMGLKRVLASHMTKPDDSSVDFMKIKPIVENLKDSEVLKALNEEFFKTKEEREKNQKKWTTFLQKPKRPVPKIRFGYYGYLDSEEEMTEPYKVKIVKQPKPKVAPDYKSEDFETGPLPWEQRAANEPSPPPIPREDPILVPEDLPEFLEAVDPLPESEVPDLEDTGILLPPPKEEAPLEIEEPEIPLEDSRTEEKEEVEEEEKKEPEEEIVEDMEQNRIAQEILGSIQNMVDPKATLDQQLQQMRAQLATLAQLPVVIQQSLELVTKQLSTINLQETSQTLTSNESVETIEFSEVTQNGSQDIEQIQEVSESIVVEQEMNGVAVQTEPKELSAEELETIRQEEMVTEEQRKAEKERKLDQESRQVKQRPTPRVGKPKPVFGPLVPQERPLVLPGGRKWRKPRDAYNEEFIAETLSAQAEIIQGKAKGLPYESVYLPYDERINFMKYEKPPVSLDHLKNSDVYRLIHDMDDSPVRRVDMLTPVVAESDYREKCRSMTPSSELVQE